LGGIFFAVAGPHCKEQSQDLRVSAQDEDDRYLKLGLLNHFCCVLSQIVRFVFFGFVAELLYRFANHSNFFAASDIYLSFTVEGDHLSVAWFVISMSSLYFTKNISKLLR